MSSSQRQHNYCKEVEVSSSQRQHNYCKEVEVSSSQRQHNYCKEVEVSSSQRQHNYCKEVYLFNYCIAAAHPSMLLAEDVVLTLRGDVSSTYMTFELNTVSGVNSKVTS